MPSFLKFLLLPFAFLYGIGLFIDRKLRSSSGKKLPRTTVSVGNITVGGTGKTPLLIRLARDLQALGKKPAILTRGYAGMLQGSGDEQSDEVTLMREKCAGVPIGVGPDRWRSAENVLRENSVDLFLLDDGFQHWALQRDWDIVCVDATQPWGGGMLLPAGRLREPVSALARAQIIVLTRTELAVPEEVQEIKRVTKEKAPAAEIFQSRFALSLVRAKNEEPASAEILRDKKVVAFSGIGNPRAFESNLHRLGAKLMAFRFSDHHAYTEADLKNLAVVAKGEGAALVTTEKDWVKIRKLSWGNPAQTPPALYRLVVSLEFSAEEEKRWQARLRKFT